MASEVDEVKQNVVEDSEELFLRGCGSRFFRKTSTPRKIEVIREYIQNASDALDDWLRIPT